MNNWSVIRTRLRWEKKVVRQLTQKGIETFCPVVKARHQWSDRVKTVEKPLLKSYVFVKVNGDQRTVVRLTDGVLNFVYRSGKPVTVKDKLVQGIQQFQQTHPALEVMAVDMPAVDRNPDAAATGGKTKSTVFWIENLNLALVACPPTPIIEDNNR